MLLVSLDLSPCALQLLSHVRILQKHVGLCTENGSQSSLLPFHPQLGRKSQSLSPHLVYIQHQVGVASAGDLLRHSLSGSL